MTMVEVVAGIDIGGTNTAVGLVTADGGLLVESTLSTGAHETIEDYAGAVRAEIQRLLKRVPEAVLKGIGIGAPNGNYYQGTIENAPNLKWRGTIPFVNMLRPGFDVPIALTNDANAAAIGEGLFGAAQGFRHFIVITLGTGVGSGIVVDGDLLYGHDGFAGEIGHTIVDPEGRECGCGRRGCLETYASAGGIKRTVFELLAESRAPSVLRDISFNDLTAQQIAQAAGNGDALALRAFDYTGKILGLKLADAVAHTSPEAIILFGGLAQAGELIFEPTRRYMDEYMLNLFKHKVKLLASGLADRNIAILGAAALVWNELVTKPATGVPA
jgi:glucokinase